MDTPIQVDLGRIAQDLQIRRVQVESVVQLLDEGNTVPFITRYRKERTGNLNEVAIREVQLRVGRLRELAERKETILKAIEAQGKLTEDLAAAIRAADNPKRLEDLYLPFKPKKKTKASEARDKGLEPLALRIWNRDETLTDLTAAAQEFLNPEKGVETVEQALEGVGHILAEAISELAAVRDAVRRVVWKTGKIVTTKAEIPEGEGLEYRDYFNYSEPVAHIPPHRVLAINRGDKEGPLKVKLEVSRPDLEGAAFGQLPLEGHPHADVFRAAAADALDRLLLPSMEREVRRDLTDMAERHAVDVFARNLRSLLLQPPIPNQVVLAIDPGFRTGCKVAVLDPHGNLLDHGVIHPHPPQNRRSEAKVYLKDLVGKHQVSVVAIGNGTACRETEELIAEIIQEGTTFSQDPEAAAAAEAAAEAHAAAHPAPNPAPAPAPEPPPAAAPAAEAPGEPQPPAPNPAPAPTVDRAEPEPAEVSQANPEAPVATADATEVPAEQAPADQAPADGEGEGGRAPEQPRESSAEVMPPIVGGAPEGEELVPAVESPAPNPEAVPAAESDAASPDPVPPPPPPAPTEGGEREGAAPRGDRNESVESLPAAEDQASPPATDETPPPAEGATTGAGGEAAVSAATGAGLAAAVEAAAESPAPAEGEGEGEHGTAPAVAPAAVSGATPPAGTLTAAEPSRGHGHKEKHRQEPRPPRPRTPPQPPRPHAADPLLAKLAYVIVNEAGASVYSASPIGREEFPDFDATLRGTISIGRRLQDPLAELVKIEPQSIGVGLYQHDVNPKQLKESLESVISSCVNFVGVDLNTASIPLLRHVSGLNQLTARRVVEYRKEKGPFSDRDQIKEVDGVGPATFTQAAGFLKLRDGSNPLDRTWVHPESYGAASTLLEKLGFAPDVVRDRERLPELHAKLAEVDFPALAKELEVGELTLRDIADALARPDRDPRDDLPKPIFKKGVLKLEDLQPGMELKGTVLNVVDFGAFVDIGLKDSGLVHISQLANRYIKSPHDVVSVGDVVTVWVMGVDQERKRVSLTMVKPGTERPRGQGGGGRRGPGGGGGGGERRGGGQGRPPRREGSALTTPPAGGAGGPGGEGAGGRPSGGAGGRGPGGPRPGAGGRGPRTGQYGGGQSRLERAQAPRPVVRPAKPAPPPPPLSRDALTGSVPLRSFGQLKQLWQARTEEPGEGEGESQGQGEGQAHAATGAEPQSQGQAHPHPEAPAPAPAPPETPTPAPEPPAAPDQG